MENENKNEDQTFHSTLATIKGTIRDIENDGSFLDGSSTYDSSYFELYSASPLSPISNYSFYSRNGNETIIPEKESIQDKNEEINNSNISLLENEKEGIILENMNEINIHEYYLNIEKELESVKDSLNTVISLHGDDNIINLSINSLPQENLETLSSPSELLEINPNSEELDINNNYKDESNLHDVLNESSYSIPSDATQENIIQDNTNNQLIDKSELYHQENNKSESENKQMNRLIRSANKKNKVINIEFNLEDQLDQDELVHNENDEIKTIEKSFLNNPISKEWVTNFAFELSENDLDTFSDNLTSDLQIEETLKQASPKVNLLDSSLNSLYLTNWTPKLTPSPKKLDSPKQSPISNVSSSKQSITPSSTSTTRKNAELNSFSASEKMSLHNLSSSVNPTQQYDNYDIKQFSPINLQSSIIKNNLNRSTESSPISKKKVTIQEDDAYPNSSTPITPSSLGISKSPTHAFSAKSSLQESPTLNLLNEYEIDDSFNWKEKSISLPTSKEIYQEDWKSYKTKSMEGMLDTSIVSLNEALKEIIIESKKVEVINKLNETQNEISSSSVDLDPSMNLKIDSYDRYTKDTSSKEDNELIDCAPIVFPSEFNVQYILSNQFKLSEILKDLEETFHLFKKKFSSSTDPVVDIDDIPTILESHGFILSQDNISVLHKLYSPAISFQSLVTFLQNNSLKRLDFLSNDIPPTSLNEIETLLQLGQNKLNAYDATQFTLLLENLYSKNTLNDSSQSEADKQAINLQNSSLRLYLESVTVDGINLYQWLNVRDFVPMKLYKLYKSQDEWSQLNHEIKDLNTSQNISNLNSNPNTILNSKLHSHFGVFISIEFNITHSSIVWNIIQDILKQFKNGTILGLDTKQRIQILFSNFANLNNFQRSKSSHLIHSPISSPVRVHNSSDISDGYFSDEIRRYSPPKSRERRKIKSASLSRRFEDHIQDDYDSDSSNYPLKLNNNNNSMNEIEVNTNENIIKDSIIFINNITKVLNQDLKVDTNIFIGVSLGLFNIYSFPSISFHVKNNKIHSKLTIVSHALDESSYAVQIGKIFQSNNINSNINLNNDSKDSIHIQKHFSNSLKSDKIIIIIHNSLQKWVDHSELENITTFYSIFKPEQFKNTNSVDNLYSLQRDSPDSLKSISKRDYISYPFSQNFESSDHRISISPKSFTKPSSINQRKTNFSIINNHDNQAKYDEDKVNISSYILDLQRDEIKQLKHFVPYHLFSSDFGFTTFDDTVIMMIKLKHDNFSLLIPSVRGFQIHEDRFSNRNSMEIDSSNLDYNNNNQLIQTIQSEFDSCIQYIETLIQSFSGLVSNIKYVDNSLVLSICFGVSQSPNSKDQDVDASICLRSANKIISFAKKYNISAYISASRGECYFGMFGDASNQYNNNNNSLQINTKNNEQKLFNIGRQKILAVWGRTYEICSHLLDLVCMLPSLDLNFLYDSSIQNNIIESESRPIKNMFIPRNPFINIFTPLFTINLDQNNTSKLENDKIHEGNTSSVITFNSILQELVIQCKSYIYKNKINNLVALKYYNEESHSILNALKSIILNENEQISERFNPIIDNMTQSIELNNIPLIIEGDLPSESSYIISFSLWRSIFQTIFNSTMEEDLNTAVLNLLNSNEKPYAPLLNIHLGTTFTETIESTQCSGKWKSDKLLQLILQLLKRSLLNHPNEKLILLFKNVHLADELSLRLIHAICNENVQVIITVGESPTLSWIFESLGIQQFIDCGEAKIENFFSKVLTWCSYLFQENVVSMTESMKNILKPYYNCNYKDWIFVKELLRYFSSKECILLKKEDFEYVASFEQKKLSFSPLKEPPSTFKDLCILRLSRMSTSFLYFLKVAAVCGFNFSLKEMYEACGHEKSLDIIEFHLNHLISNKNVSELSFITFLWSDHELYSQNIIQASNQTSLKENALANNTKLYTFKNSDIWGLIYATSGDLKYKIHLNLAKYYFNLFKNKPKTISQKDTQKYIHILHKYLFHKFQSNQSIHATNKNSNNFIESSDIADIVKASLKISELYSQNNMFTLASYTLKKAWSLLEDQLKETKGNINQNFSWASELFASVIFAYFIVSSIEKNPNKNKDYALEFIKILVLASKHATKNNPVYFDIHWYIWWFSYMFEFDEMQQFLNESNFSVRKLNKILLSYTEIVKDNSLKMVYEEFAYFSAARTGFRFKLKDSMKHCEMALSLYEKENIISTASNDFGKIDPKTYLLIEILNIQSLQLNFQKANEIYSQLVQHMDNISNIQTRVYYLQRVALYLALRAESLEQLNYFVQEATEFIKNNNLNHCFDEDLKIIKFITHYSLFRENSTMFHIEAMNTIISTLDPYEKSIILTERISIQYCIILFMRSIDKFLDICSLQEKKDIISNNYSTNMNSGAMLDETFVEITYLQAKISMLMDEHNTDFSFQKQVNVLRSYYYSKMSNFVGLELKSVKLLLNIWKENLNSNYSRLNFSIKMIEDIIQKIKSSSKLQHLPENIVQDLSLLEKTKHKLEISKENQKIKKYLIKLEESSEIYLRTLHNRFISNMRLHNYISSYLQGIKLSEVESKAIKLEEKVPNLGNLITTKGESLQWNDLIYNNHAIVISFVPSLSNPWSKWNLDRLNSMYLEFKALKTEVLFISVDPRLEEIHDSLVPLIFDNSLRISSEFRLLLPSTIVSLYNQCISQIIQEIGVIPLCDHEFENKKKHEEFHENRIKSANVQKIRTTDIQKRETENILSKKYGSDLSLTEMEQLSQKHLSHYDSIENQRTSPRPSLPNSSPNPHIHESTPRRASSSYLPMKPTKLIKDFPSLNNLTLNATYIIDTRLESVVTLYLDGDFRKQIRTMDIMDTLLIQNQQIFDKNLIH